MPKRVEDKLRKSCRKLGLTDDRLNACIYGTMHKLGLMRKKRRKRR